MGGRRRRCPVSENVRLRRFPFQTGHSDNPSTNPPFNFWQCIAELREKAGILQKSGFIHVVDTGITVVKSETAVSPALQKALRDYVKQLEDVPEIEKDWHPGSDGKVLDLVHPSLFPLVYGVSRVLSTGTVPLKDCALFTGKGEEVHRIEEPLAYHKTLSCGNSSSLPAWGNFQWLPSDIQIDIDGKAKITSYINNLHPEDHEYLYSILEHLVECAIPLWNESLSWFHNRIRIPVLNTSRDDYYIPNELKFQPAEVDSDDYLDSDASEPKSEIDFESDDRYAEEYEGWWKIDRILNHPEPGTFVPWEQKVESQPEGAFGVAKVNLERDFASSELQIIFKLANIHLTPDKPEYGGGSWQGRKTTERKRY